MTKDIFLKKIEEIDRARDKHFGVLVKNSKSFEPELIINPSINLKDKLDYYKLAYDEDMKLFANKNIVIVDVVGIKISKEIDDIYKDYIKDIEYREAD